MAARELGPGLALTHFPLQCSQRFVGSEAQALAQTPSGSCGALETEVLGRMVVRSTRNRSRTVARRERLDDSGHTLTRVAAAGSVCVASEA
jgi:hypothetical protein